MNPPRADDRPVAEFGSIALPKRYRLRIVGLSLLKKLFAEAALFWRLTTALFVCIS
jgi:hypothetical protein